MPTFKDAIVKLYGGRCGRIGCRIHNNGPAVHKNGGNIYVCKCDETRDSVWCEVCRDLHTSCRMIEIGDLDAAEQRQLFDNKVRLSQSHAINIRH